MKRPRRIGALIVLLLASYAPAASAERVRGPVVESRTIEGPGAVEIALKANDLAAVFLESDPRLLLGIELDVEIPARARSFGAAFLLSLYSGVTPSPSSARMDYHATTKRFVRLVPDRTNTIIVPFSLPASVERRTPVLDGVSYDASPFLLSVEPFSKALPDSLAAATFRITVRGVFADSGVLALDLQTPSGSFPPFEVTLDGEKKQYERNGYVLGPGVHTLKITAEPSFESIRNVLIKAGRVSRVVVVFETENPTVRIEAPEGAAIYLDGQRYLPATHRTVEVVPGEHSVLIQLGDYAISRRFTVESGKDYTIELILDIIVEETR